MIRTWVSMKGSQHNNIFSLWYGMVETFKLGSTENIRVLGTFYKRIWLTSDLSFFSFIFWSQGESFIFAMGFCCDVFPYHKAQRKNSIISRSAIFKFANQKWIFSFAHWFSKITFIAKEFKYHLCLTPVFFIYFYKKCYFKQFLKLKFTLGHLFRYAFFHFIFVCCCSDGISLCNGTSFAESHSADHTGIKFMEICLPLSPKTVLGLKVCAATVQFLIFISFI